MKKIVLSCAMLLISFAATAQILGEDNTPQRVVVEQGLKFCEGTTFHRNTLLVSNFGTTELNPLNTEGKGYVVSISADGKVKPFIPADGNLSAPKGMVVVGNYIYIADVGKVVVYDIKHLNTKPQIITFPEEDLFVNDVAQMGDMLLVTVTNTGRLYGVDITKPQSVASQKPQLIGNVAGANGIAVSNNMIYIASYNPDGKPTAQNVIYAYDMFTNKMKKLIANLTPGQYDGIALSADGTTLYFTAWDNLKGDGGALYSYLLDGKHEATQVGLGIKFKGPADISIKGNMLWLPDLAASKVYGFPL